MAAAAPFDPFKVLDLPRTASQTRIKARYRQLARRYHPNRIDRNGSTAASLADQFHQIYQAWRILSNSEVRQRYIQILELFELQKSILSTFVDLLQPNSPSDSATKNEERADEVHESSDADDEDLPSGIGIKRRATFEHGRNGKSHLHDITEHSEDDDDEDSTQTARNNTRNHNGITEEGSGHDSRETFQNTATMRRMKHDKLRGKELSAFERYRDAMLDKFEAEEAASEAKELYEQAKWRREYFERAPRETRQRVRLARMITSVAKTFRGLQASRPRTEPGVSYSDQILSTGDPIDNSQLLALPSRMKSVHKRGWSSDISGDQTSSDEDDYSSDRGTSPSRSPHPVSPRTSHGFDRRADSGSSKLLPLSTNHLVNGTHDPISPITGPVKVLVRAASNLHEAFIPRESDPDTASESSSPSPNGRRPESVGFTLVPPMSVAEVLGHEEHRSRSPSTRQQSHRTRSPTPGSKVGTPEPVHFMIKQVYPTQFRNIPADNVHDMTYAEKQIMLGVQPDADMDPWELMKRLKRLDHNVARNFMVKPDIKASFHFRLIYSHREVVKQQHQTFIALSYRRKLHVEKRHGHFSLPLDPELFQAVWDERQADTEGVWIDQICIDGSSDEEKTISMSAMDMVYRSARLVVVVLDDIQLETAEAALLSAHMDDYNRMMHVPANKRFRRRQTPYLEAHDDLYNIIRKILRSSWFRRAWCRHEMRLAREHIFLIPCGSTQSSSLDSIIRFTSKCLTHFLGLATEVPFQLSIEAVKPALYAFFRDRSKLLAHEHLLRLHHGNFTTVVAEVFAMEAGGDPRIPEEQRESDARKDKISIILNTMECGLQLGPQVRHPGLVLSTPQCHYMLLLLALAARDPGALSSAGHSLLSLPDAPSQSRVASTWLFEPTNVDSGLNNYRTLNRLPAHSHISTGNDEGHHTVELDLKFVSGEKVLHAFESSLALEQARRLIAHCNSKRLGRNRKRYLINDKTANRLFGSMEDVYVDTLACVLECGPKWVCEVCQRYGVSRWKQDLTAAYELLVALKNTDGKWPEDAWSSHGVGFLMDFANFLIIRGLPQRQITQMEPWRPIWTAPATGGKVLTFIPPGKIRAAVPTALLDADYIHLARLWVLEPRWHGDHNAETDSHRNEWTLLGKSVLFSDNAAVEQLSENNRVTRTRQKVFGRVPPPR